MSAVARRILLARNENTSTVMVLSGCVLIEYRGWTEAADLIREAVEAQIQSRRVTYDIERQIEGGERVATSEYAEGIVEQIETLA